MHLAIPKTKALFRKAFSTQCGMHKMLNMLMLSKYYCCYYCYILNQVSRAVLVNDFKEANYLCNLVGYVNTEEGKD